MLTEIRLKNFKCFKEMTSIPVGKINLFTGINGRGKSTVLQALLLMRQSPEHSRTTNQIIFNGSCVELGNFDDIRNRSISQTEAIELFFGFRQDTNYVNLHYFLQANDKDDMVADIEKIEGFGKTSNEEYDFRVEEEGNLPVINYNNQTIYEGNRWYNLFVLEDDDEIGFIQEPIEFAKTHYISADRIGPQDFYEKQSFTEFPNVGRRGEYTANVLSKKKDDLVYEQLCLAEGETRTVLDQTAAWLSKIFDGGKVDVKSLEANIVLMELTSEKPRRPYGPVNLYKPVNVGFGYSYALPIIVSGLIARTGETLIVENPEAHLHPYAQSQITKFLSEVSACGIQVFIESHSDHILNALRIAILDKIITPDDLNVLYFQDGEDIQIVEIPVGADGSIENWPNGFFDQTDKDFERLFGV